MKVQKFIEVRLLKKRMTSPVDVVQYNTGVQLVFSVVDFDIPSGTTATLYVQKRSGKFVYQEKNIAVSGNEITIDLENQVLTEHGETKYQVMLKNGTDTVTTFAGVLRIEKSLADANAVESKTVIRAFDEAVADHVAEFQSKAEQIVQACIATIPEDYTVMEAKVNELANAVKGYLSGAVVFADDVSPVEHSPAVRVHGKNLFDTSKIAVQANTDNIYISAVGEGYIDITTKEAYDGNGHCVTWVKLKELCPQMQAGKQYALSGTTTAWNKMIYLKEIDLFWSYGTRRVVTEEMLECTIGFYGLNSIREQGFGTCRISNIQCEEGYDITEYTPYIDPATVTVKRVSKNLIDCELMKSEATLNGVTITRNGDILTLNGTLTVDSVLFNTHFCHHGGLGNNYTLSYKHTGGTVTGTASVCVGDSETFDSARQSWANVKMQNSDNTFSYPMTKPFIKDLWFYAMAGVVFNNYKIRIQLEPGMKATGVETCNGAEYIPASDGTIPDLTSLSPNMTILTDTVGATVDCEYNRDTNKVIEKLTNAIIALGGTV